MTEVMEQVILDLGEILLDAKADKDKIQVAIKRILSILEVKDPDQSLPGFVNGIMSDPSSDYIRGLRDALNRMMDENWMKVLVKEEKSNE